MTTYPADGKFSCPFCSPNPEKIVFQDANTLALWDGYPVSSGHLLLVPKRHVETWFEAENFERLSLFSAIDKAKEEIEKRFSPQGYNIGINVGEAAGQTIRHLHVHIIPRYTGDVPDPRGGVRYVIPEKADYLGHTASEAPQSYFIERPKLLTTGGNDPLLTHILHSLDKAQRVDVLVAFVKLSGTKLLWSRLVEVLERGGKVRVLTGDYLGVTDPKALTDLVNLAETGGHLELRVFNTNSLGVSGIPPQAFHPKAYIFHYENGVGSAFVGSSNLSRSALVDGIEWNYQLISSRDSMGFNAIVSGFEAIFSHPATTNLTTEWIENYEQHLAWRPLSIPIDSAPDVEPAEIVDVPKPHEIQLLALSALREARNAGKRKGLVVLATGLGKTWLSAFDSKEFQRVLFVGHREEILKQAFNNYRRIRPGEYLGMYNGTEKHPKAKVVFASIQSISRDVHLHKFGPDHFDYIVVDEFHHAEAATYRKVLQHFSPTFLLGLTATPERSDGADLFDLCDGNLIYRCDLADGVAKGLLCPFHYFGVPDDVDYRNIPWRNSKFDEEKLTTALATRRRAQNALEQLAAKGGSKVIAFCASQRHADFMADFFRRNGKSAVSVHSGQSSAPRTESLEKLQRGELDIICAVDMFNEGVDLPELDTVLMLRPTESKILWLQQFGRGLRKASEDKVLKVIDYIGNHRSFLTKARALFNLQAGDAALQFLLDQLDSFRSALPQGCDVTYDLEAINIMRALLRVEPDAIDALESFIKDFKDMHGVRPTALEVYREGFDPRKVKNRTGCWFEFLKKIGELDDEDVTTLAEHGKFFAELEMTPMSKSYKMLVLLVLLNHDLLPGSITLAGLASEMRKYVDEHPMLMADFGEAINSDVDMARHMESNPIAAWADGRGTGGTTYFSYVHAVFSSAFSVSGNLRKSFQRLTRELVEWRLAEYMDRPSFSSTILLNVAKRRDGRAYLDSQGALLHIPDGTYSLSIEGMHYSAVFTNGGCSLIFRSNSSDNQLPRLIRGWFGANAGLPGTRHQMRLEKRSEAEWSLTPVGIGGLGAVRWREYAREQIPPLFNLQFNQGTWLKGFIPQGDKIFLLITLDKSEAAEAHQYEDKFLGSDLFQWQSQNQTSQQSEIGQRIKNHKELGVEMHLFVRRTKKIRGAASPFVYCGLVDFVSWERNKPITIICRLRDPVPEHLHAKLGFA